MRQQHWRNNVNYRAVNQIQRGVDKADNYQNTHQTDQRELHGRALMHIGKLVASRGLPLESCSRSACARAGACSDAPAAAGSAAVTTVAAAVVVGVIGISAAGGSNRSPACREWTAPGAGSWSRWRRGPSRAAGSRATSSRSARGWTERREPEDRKPFSLSRHPRDRRTRPEDPPSWADILRTIELGFSNARLERSATGSRSPSAWPTASTASPTSSP